MPPVDFEPTFTHYKLLFCADSSNLNELRSGLKTHGFPQDYDWPATPLREAKRALRELIEAGLIEVYAEVGVPLSQQDALAAIEPDSAWEPKLPDAPDHYEVYFTDTGVTALQALKPKFGHVGLVETKN